MIWSVTLEPVFSLAVLRKLFFDISSITELSWSCLLYTSDAADE